MKGDGIMARGPQNSGLGLRLATGLGTILLTISLSSSVCATSVKERRFIEILAALQSGEATTGKAKEECLLALSTSAHAQPMRDLFSGFFTVSTSEALVRLCETIARAVAAGDLSPELVNRALVSEEDDGPVSPDLGRLMRAVYFAAGG